MIDVLKFNEAIIHPDAIREVYIVENTTKVQVITDVAIHEKEFDSDHQAQAAVDKIAEYLNIVEVI